MSSLHIKDNYYVTIFEEVPGGDLNMYRFIDDKFWPIDGHKYTHQEDFKVMRSHLPKICDYE